MAVTITKERKVNEAPVAADLNTLREFGHAINELLDGPPPVLTANLPAADAKLDGLVVMEDLTGGNFNLVIYMGGSRIRFTGSSF